MSDTTSGDFVGLGDIPRKTQVSKFENGTWQFIDPESLSWIKIDEYLHEYTTRVRLGIVLNTYRLPDQCVEYVEPGNKIIRDSSNILIVYHKLNGKDPLL